MRKAAVLALTVLLAPTVGAAVLPVGVVALDGRHLRSVVSVPSAALGNQSAPSAAYRGEWTADTRNTWRDNDNEPRVQFNLRTAAGDSRWGFGVRLRDLAGLPPAAIANMANDVQFTWTREAGTFRFSGSFDQGRGSGTYAFTHDTAFVSNMAAAGYRNLAADDIVRLAVIDVTLAHVRGLAQAGYLNLPIDDVVRTRIHRVTPEFVRELEALGYKGIALDDLIRFRIHKVTPAFIKAIEARGYKSVPGDDLVRMRIHKVTPDYIRAMHAVGFTSASEDQLVKMRIHKVDAQFVRHAREDGLTVATPADAVDLAIHGPRWKRRR